MPVHHRRSTGAAAAELRALTNYDSPREAFGRPTPPCVLRAAVRGGLRLRGRVLRLLPARREPFYARQGPNIRGCRGGCRMAELGTAPTTGQGACPVAPAERTRSVAE